MSQNSAVPPPHEQSPLCTAYAPLLPFLPTGDLQADESAALRAHVATCAWCQAKLAEYDALYTALQRQFGPAVDRPGTAITPMLMVAEVASLDQRTLFAPRSASHDSARVRVSSGTFVARRRAPSAVFAVAAVLLLIMMAGALFSWQRKAGESETSLDPQARAYVAVLRQYYPPAVDAVGQDWRDCNATFGNIPTSSQQQVMTDCRSTEVAVVTASQALLTHLEAASPPERWRMANQELEQWAQALIMAFNHRIAAIDAHDTARFTALATSEVLPASGRSCAPINQVNAELPFASQLPEAAVGC